MLDVVLSRNVHLLKVFLTKLNLCPSPSSTNLIKMSSWPPMRVCRSLPLRPTSNCLFLAPEVRNRSRNRQQEQEKEQD